MRSSCLVAMLLTACAPRATPPAPTEVAPTVPAPDELEEPATLLTCGEHGRIDVLAVPSGYKVFICGDFESGRNVSPYGIRIGSQRDSAAGANQFGQLVGFFDQLPAIGDEVYVSVHGTEIYYTTITAADLEDVDPASSSRP